MKYYKLYMKENQYTIDVQYLFTYYYLLILVCHLPLNSIVKCLSLYSQAIYYSLL